MEILCVRLDTLQIAIANKLTELQLFDGLGLDLDPLEAQMDHLLAKIDVYSDQIDQDELLDKQQVERQLQMGRLYRDLTREKNKST